MADVIEINDPDELEPYRMVWNALLPQTSRVSFFHSFDWLQTFWKHFGQELRMRVLIVRALGKPIGIVPLCVRRERYHVAKLRVLTYPLADWGMWYGPIGPDPSASLFMAFKHLRDTPRDWDMVDLRWSAAELNDRNTTGRALRAVGWQPQKITYQHNSVIRLANSDHDAYLRELPKKWRHEIRRQQRVLERDCDVSFERHRPDSAAEGGGDPCWDLYGNCLSVSRKSWQGGSTTGNTLCHDRVRSFLRDCHRVAARLGMLDLAVLKVNGRPAAFQYNYHYQGNIFGLRMGFDPKFTQLGVGKVLMSRLIEDSFARGDQALDLGTGDYDFKRRFRTEVETSSRFVCYPWSSWRSQGVRLTRWLKGTREAGKVAVPSKAGSKSASA